MKDIESLLSWKKHSYHQVVELPNDYTVLDLSQEKWPRTDAVFSIGKYNELRPHLYNSPIFGGIRNIHVGIDINGPEGTACMAFADGKIKNFGYNSESGDYGFVIITEHLVSGVKFWALYGHLNSNSVKDKKVGQRIKKGETIAWFGPKNENGGWEPHLHFQLSLIEPKTHDLPGVVSLEDREQALRDFPDPRIILGPIY